MATRLGPGGDELFYRVSAESPRQAGEAARFNQSPVHFFLPDGEDGDSIESN